jgi:hypothetical protein
MSTASRLKSITVVNTSERDGHLLLEIPEEILREMIAMIRVQKEIILQRF